MARTTDGWYSWIVLAASLITNLLTMGFLFGSIGVLVSEYNIQFRVDIRTSSWVGSVLTGVLLFSGPLAAYFVGKLGCRWVAVAATCLHIGGLAMSAFATKIWVIIFTFSILSGFASSCCHVSTMKILTRYFVRYQHLAFAVAAVGSDLATVSFPFITRFILDSLSYKYGILALSAILLPAVPCGALYIEHGITKPDTEQKLSSLEEDEGLSPETALTASGREGDSKPKQVEVTSTPTSEPEYIFRDHIAMLKKPAICVFLINTVLWNCGGSIVGVLAYSYYLDTGLTATMASTGMTCYGFGSLFGSVSLAVISVKLSFNRLITHWILNILLAAILFAFPSIRDHILMAAALALFGFSYGTLCANLGSLTEHINGSESLYLVYSYEMAAGGIGSFIGPGVSAHLQKTYNSAIGFYFGGAMCTLALLVMVIYTIVNPSFLKPVGTRQQRKEGQTETGDNLHSNLSLAAAL